MKQFIAGFLVASLIWVGVLCVMEREALFGVVSASDQSTPDGGLYPETETESAKKKGKKKGRRGRKRPGAKPGGGSSVDGHAQSGEDVGSPGSGSLDLGGSGKEEQLKEAEIDRGIDRVFKGIERCLVLVPAEASASGRVVVGMRISGSGQVTKVNLKGPGPLVTGEAGGCIRRAVKSITYRTFDGPDMVVNYPITFE